MKDTFDTRANPEGAPPLPTVRRYDIVVADPPWTFTTRSAKGLEGRPQHYDRMTDQDIAAMPVQAISHAGTVLFLWTTSPHLPRGLDTLAVWGFTYRSSMVWVKDRVGTGYWARNRHELVLIGGRSKARAPAPAHRRDSVIEGQQRAHSVKPDALQDWIDATWPGASKIELFARRARPSWAVWGNEAPNHGKEPTRGAASRP